jgi:hypothetical protein
LARLPSADSTIHLLRDFAGRQAKACYAPQMPCSRIALIAALMAFSALSGCTASRSAIGAGAYRYQFVLNDPHLGTPLPHHPYALMVDGYPLPFAREGKGRLGDPCLMVARSRSLLAQAKRLAVGQNGELWLTYVDAEKTKIDEMSTKFRCAIVNLKGKSSGH